MKDWKCGDRNNENGGGRVRGVEDGVRVWLNGLGLGRYAPVFEVHEVDDEVLPMLTHCSKLILINVICNIYLLAIYIKPLTRYFISSRTTFVMFRFITLLRNHISHESKI